MSNRHPRKNRSHGSEQPTSRIIAQQTTIYRGQLPPPEMLEKFESIQPGFTDRLLKLVEKESAFKQEYDRSSLGALKISTVLGIVAAILAVAIVAVVSIYALYRGYEGAAATIMSTCVVGVVIAFIQKRKANN
jgi:uncharacterized membrane protein